MDQHWGGGYEGAADGQKLGATEGDEAWRFAA